MTNRTLLVNAAHAVDHVVRGQTGGLIDDQDSVHSSSLLSWTWLASQATQPEISCNSDGVKTMLPIRDDQPRFSTPYVTYFLIAINVIIFFFESALDPENFRLFLYHIGLIPAHVTALLTWFGLGFFYLPAWVMLGFWFVYQFLSGAASAVAYSGQTGGVAFWAHVGGFVAGIVLIKIFPQRAGRDRYGTW